MRDHHHMPALRTIALLVITVWGSNSYAAGLGAVRTQSSLGEPFRASIPLFGYDPQEISANCVKASLEQPDGTFITGTQVAFSGQMQGTVLHLATYTAINEPALALKVDIGCGMPIHRTYSVLLDPVVNLPQAASARTSNESARVSRAGQVAQLVTSSSDVPAPDTRHKSTVRSAAAVSRPHEAGGASAQTVPVEQRSEYGRKEAKKVVRNVLKLSSDDETIDTSGSAGVFSPTLKLSDSLSESRDTGSPQKMAELKDAHARFAAVLRGEDPVQNDQIQIKTMQVKLQDLEKHVEQIRHQGEQQRQAETTSMRREMFSSEWIIGLGALLLAALSAIGWLIWRLQYTFSGNRAAFWEKTIIDEQHESQDWDETLSPPLRKHKVAGDASLQDDTLTPDWEQIVPLNSTLTVDRAARQEALQNANQQSQPADDNKQALLGESETLAKPQQTEQFSVGTAIPDMGLDFPRIVSPQSIKVEEVSGLLQEAEFWMLLNDPERALAILEPIANVEQHVSPVPWIYLLDLYRVTDQQDKYEALRARVKQIFNTNVPTWDKAFEEERNRSLQDYPHVIQSIQDLWEGDCIVPYLESLLFDERDGARAGFDLSVYREIIHLIGVARDPDMPKQRTHLNFGKPERRMISEQLKMVDKPGVSP